jgi:hypothetical protein
VVVVHVTGAASGLTREEQRDTVRRLLLASGIIDLSGLIAWLRSIGYDDPLMPAPPPRPAAP